MRKIAILSLVLSFIGAVPGYAIGPCREVTEITSTGNTLTLSSSKTTFCGVQFIATAANGHVRVYDSPDCSEDHAQARTLAEPSAATSGNSDSAWFGNPGYNTRFGLCASVDHGRAYIFWGG